MQIKGTLKIEQKGDEFYKRFLVISNYQRIFNDYCWWSGRLTRISLTRTSRHLSWSRLVPAFSCSTTSSDSHYTTRFRHQVPQNLFRSLRWQASFARYFPSQASCRDCFSALCTHELAAVANVKMYTFC